MSLAAPYPGTVFHEQAVDNGWLNESKVITVVNSTGTQLPAIGYPHLSREEIYRSVGDFYKRFCFRPTKIWEIFREMLVSWEMMKWRLQEGVQFFRFPGA